MIQLIKSISYKLFLLQKLRTRAHDAILYFTVLPKREKILL